MVGTVAGAERYVFTVFTPTLDRAHTLERVYRSLIAQTFRDFEWIVVDDGSTDGTEQLVRGWRAVAHFRSPTGSRSIAASTSRRIGPSRLSAVTSSSPSTPTTAACPGPPSASSSTGMRSARPTIIASRR